MHNITKPSATQYVVRVDRFGQRHTKSFSASEYGSVENALTAAKAWRDDVIAKYTAPVHIHTRQRKTKSNQELGCGVTVSEWADTRGAGSDRMYRQYQALYYMGGKRKIKSFHVGVVGVASVDIDEHAKQTAMAFRQEYEWCTREGVEFKPEKYDGWRTVVMYPFVVTFEVV